jgi:transcriptional regulator with XRE-family HTH domain
MATCFCKFMLDSVARCFYVLNMPRKRTSEPIHGPATRLVRERSGFSVGGFVEALRLECDIKVTSQTISNIEAGRRNPSPELLDAMAHVLRCRKTDLLRCPTEGDGCSYHGTDKPYVRSFQRAAA